MNTTNELRTLSGNELVRRTALLWLSTASLLAIMLYFLVFPDRMAITIFAVYPAVNLLFFLGIRTYGRFHPWQLQKQLMTEYRENLMIIDLCEACVDIVTDIISTLTEREEVLFYRIAVLYFNEKPSVSNTDINQLHAFCSNFSVSDAFFQLSKTPRLLEQELFCLKLKQRSILDVTSHNTTTSSRYRGGDIFTRIALRNYVTNQHERWQKLNNTYQKEIKSYQHRNNELQRILNISQSSGSNTMPETEGVE